MIVAEFFVGLKLIFANHHQFIRIYRMTLDFSLREKFPPSKINISSYAVYLIVDSVCLLELSE